MSGKHPAEGVNVMTFAIKRKVLASLWVAYQLMRLIPDKNPGEAELNIRILFCFNRCNALRAGKR